MAYRQIDNYIYAKGALDISGFSITLFIKK